MRTHVWKRLMSAGMVAAMALGVMACGGDGGSKTTPTPQATGTPGQEQTTTTPTPEVTQKPEITEEMLHEMTFASLKEAYADYFMLGTIYNQNMPSKDQELINLHFNQLTAENMMKPDATQPSEGNFNLNPAKFMLSYAKTNNHTVHGHVLAWHQQSGNWLGINVDRETAIAQLKAHIEGVAGGLGDGIYSWDVVNEAIKDGAKLPANGDWTRCLRETQWTQSIGTDYIALAFQFAREAAPNAVLYYNDYNMDNPDKAEIVAAMVADLRAQGIPVDGIGMQGHYTTQTSLGNVAKSLELFSQIEGIKISVSELDVGIAGLTTGKYTEDQEMQQAVFYANLFLLYKDYADVIERVTLWGYRDNTSWRSETAPLIFNAMLQPKEAFYALMNPELYSELETSGMTLETKQAVAVYGTPDINGVADECWSAAPKYEISNALWAWQGATGTIQLMWDENYIYALFDINDSELNMSNPNKYEQDSVEFFLDQNNCKRSYYDEGCGQYRVNYNSDKSFGAVPTEEGVKASAFFKQGGYIVEIRIPLLKPGTKGTVMGFDAQVNDANAQGVRQSIMKFNGNTDFAYNNPSMWAEVTFE